MTVKACRPLVNVRNLNVLNINVFINDGINEMLYVRYFKENNVERFLKCLTLTFISFWSVNVNSSFQVVAMKYGIALPLSHLYRLFRLFSWHSLDWIIQIHHVIVYSVFNLTFHIWNFSYIFKGKMILGDHSMHQVWKT